MVRIEPNITILTDDFTVMKVNLWGSEEISYLLLSLVEWWQRSAEAGDIEVAGVQAHISGWESHQELVWVWPPLLLAAALHLLVSLAFLPQQENV